MTQPNLDPVRLEVFRNALTAIADEMGVALRRAAYSTNIKTRLDYSCAIFDAEARMLAQAFTQPVHLGTLRHFVPRILDRVGVENLRPGDGVLCNDGHLGGIHLNDVCLVSPVHEGGHLLGYVATIAHHVDVGGGTPGSIGLFKEIFQEGMQIPAVKLVKEGRVDEELLSFFVRNVRAARETAGDLRAQIAGVNRGQMRIGELVARHGVAFYEQAADAVLDHAERLTRGAIARTIPSGTYSDEGYLDDDGFSDEPVAIRVSIEVDGDVVRYDLTDCAEQRRASINTTYAMSFSACAYTLRALLGDVAIPMNDGFYRCIEVVTRAGTVADATRPAAIGAGADVGARILEVCLRAFGERLPERVPADSKGTMCNISFGGDDPRTGEVFTFYEAQAGGYGGRAGLDGMDAVQPHMQNTENAPVEETEVNYPVSIVRYQLIPDSGGAGEFRGGAGLRRDYRFEGEVEFSVMADRVRFVPEGLVGGGPGRPSRFVVNPDSEPVELPSKFSIGLGPDDVISVQMGGGGGYGDPSDRDPERTREDIENGIITPERAREQYGYEVGP